MPLYYDVFYNGKQWCFSIRSGIIILSEKSKCDIKKRSAFLFANCRERLQIMIHFFVRAVVRFVCRIDNCLRKIPARSGGRCDCLLFLVEQNALVDRLATYWTLRHPVAAHLAGAVSAQEDHVFQTIQANRTHGLQQEKNQNLSWIICDIPSEFYYS